MSQGVCQGEYIGRQVSVDGPPWKGKIDTSVDERMVGNLWQSADNARPRDETWSNTRDRR